MSAEIYRTLAWLPGPPPDFAAACHALESTEGVGKRIQSLASHSLNESQIQQLYKAIRRSTAARLDMAPLVSFRLGVLSNGTVDLIVPPLVVSAARYGFLLDCVTVPFGQAVQEALAPNSTIHSAGVDAVLVALDYRGVQLKLAVGNEAASRAGVEAAVEHISVIRRGIRNHSRVSCILQTLARPPEALFGNLDRTTAGVWRSLIDSFNRRLCESISGSGDLLLDVAAIAECVGLADWHSPSEWNLARLPFAYTFTPLYSENVSRLIAALRGKSRRCLVLDLDNTLWGGVIGDDGLEGIQLSHGDATGEAFLGVQEFATSLRQRGIVLAVCSKNEDANARLPFREHKEMVLREEDFAVFMANWNDKASNLQAISETIGLGLDSFVFLDDNPAERIRIRQSLPEVAVPELPADPALYVRTLSAAGYFESIAFSDEDLKRAGFYDSNARRASLKNEIGGLDEYLRSLKMEIYFQAFESATRVRITQLINKSNQFNLTTRRYTENEVAALELSGSHWTLQVRLSDAFGDNGMISVVICRDIGAAKWEIDTWLMSCRVLGRRVEQMVLGEILRGARERNVQTLIGVYRPTERNNLVRHHYRDLGFHHVGVEPDGTEFWELDVTTGQIPEPPMVVHRIEAARKVAV
jgi:FkbH-like protein